MRKLIPTLVIALVLTAVPAMAQQAKQEQPSITQVKPPSFADLADKLLPAVVNISSTQKPADMEDYPEMPQFPPGSPFEDFFEEFMGKHGHGMPSTPPASLGSGFIIDSKNGYIVTNNHVIKDADDVRVTLADDTTVEARIIGHDEKTDLAVLQIPTDHALTAVPFGNSDTMRVGDWIVAIGNPFGLGGTVTAGIISAQQRDINAGPYDDFIQTDASINRGNSGGPMFDLNGEVIGINTAIFSPSGGSVGIGFAIPSNLAKPVIDQLIKFGHTRRGWLGVRIQSVTDEIADSLGLDRARGALVASVTDSGPAQKAGLEAGDIIIGFNGKPVEAMRDLPRMVAETPIGEDVTLTYWRDGKENKARAKIGELEKAEEDGLLTTGPSDENTEEGKGVTIESVGMTVGSITQADREQYSIPSDVEGVLVTTLESGSEAAEKGLEPGDVIIEVNQQQVSDPKEVANIIDDAKKGGRSSVLLLVHRDDDVRFVALRLKGG